MILIAALIYIGKILGGLALVHLVWDAREPKQLLFKLFLGVGAGLGLSSMLYFLWFWVGLPATYYPYFELLLIAVLLAATFSREFQSHPRGATVFQLSRPDARTVAWLVLLIVAAALSTLNFALYSAQSPHGYEDAWTIWNSAARFIYLAGDQWLALMANGSWFHSDYPVMLGLNVAEGWSIVGMDTTRIPMVVAYIFDFAVVGLLFSALMISKDFEQGALAAILIASVTQLPFLGAWQYADVPLSYFFLATGVLFYLYTLLGETRLVVLAGLFACLAAWTKNEGVPFVLLSLCITLSLSVLKKNNLLKHFGMGALFPAMVILLFKVAAPPSDLFVDKTKSLLQLVDLSRYQVIFGKMGAFIFSFGGWPVSFALVLLVYILFLAAKPRYQGNLWFPALLCLFQLAGYFVIYLITPHGLANHIDTSLDRLLFHLFPLALFTVFCALPSPREIFAGTPPAGSQASPEQG